MHKKFLKRLQKLIHQSSVLPIDEHSKIIFFSDCHRGYGGHADDFAHNQLLFLRALTHYKNKDYTCIELGDGDELWENKDFERIKDNYRTLFELLHELHTQNRLYLLWGNHNRKWKKKRKVNKGFATITDDKTGEKKPLFNDLTIHEFLVLQYKKEKNKILLLHGHQGDCLNDTCWWFGRFVVRKIWVFLQSIIGIPDPTSPARNYRMMLRTDDRFKRWVIKTKTPIIIGHTHKPVFPREGEPSYFNDGSCVHPRCITGIEIAEGKIQLVKWHRDVHTKEDWKEDLLYVNRTLLAGPREMDELFEV